jgi:hypothetical protein
MAKLWNPIFRKEDKEILLFLWRHRLATFQALKKIFYPTLSNRQAYDKLKRLIKGKYIMINKIDGAQERVWQLDKRGFNYLKYELMIEMKSKTYKPQSGYHDLMAMAALLGNWAVQPPREVKIVTELELMETEVDDLPQTVLENTNRRPDGLWLYQNNQNPFAIALEVELSRKATIEYEQICNYYGKNLFIKHVIWIVDSQALAARIHSVASKYGNPRPGLHCFVLKSDFEKRLWQAEFVNTSLKGVSIHNFLNQQMQNNTFKTQRSIQQTPQTNLGETILAKCNYLLNFDLSLDKTEAYENQI